jgi:hypothetical protein
MAAKVNSSIFSSSSSSTGSPGNFLTFGFILIDGANFGISFSSRSFNSLSDIGLSGRSGSITGYCGNYNNIIVY